MGNALGRSLFLIVESRNIFGSLALDFLVSYVDFVVVELDYCEEIEIVAMKVLAGGLLMGP